jgi:hypothetical protein
MKKLLILSLAALMVVAFTLPASALENVFGGYWRTRAYSQQDFSGLDDSAQDYSAVDTRTRLYYTAILNDNLKFVNKFEMNATWGQANRSTNDTGIAAVDESLTGTVDGNSNVQNYGDFGADGIGVKVKQSYADFSVGALRFTVGVQGHAIGRSLVFDNDYSGVTASFKMGDHLIPFTWARINEGGFDNNSQDADMFALWPVFQLGESFSINPFIVYSYSDNTGRNDSAVPGEAVTRNSIQGLPADADDGAGIYHIGANVDVTLGAFNLWGTGVYVGGNADRTVGGDYDVQAYVFALGADVPLGPASVHGQFFLGSGDDDPTDQDLEAYFGTSMSYYWAEIMGYGTFDNQLSAGTPGDQISNIWALNIGATIQPMEKLSLTGDIWYAALVEDDANGNDELGIEIDLKASYQLVEGLNLDIIAAYLLADDATTAGVDNDEDPFEVGTQLSLSF